MKYLISTTIGAFLAAVPLARLPMPANAQTIDWTNETGGICQCICPENQPPEVIVPPTEELEAPPDDATTTDQPDGEIAPTDPDVQAEPAPAASPVFNELLPDPVGKDTDGEFIELASRSDVDQDLTGWSIRAASGKIFVIASAILPAGGQLQFIYAESKLPLPNDGTTLTLIAPTGDVADSVTYPGPAKEGKSFARDASSAWQWTSRPTPGAANEFGSPAPPPPVIDVTETAGQVDATADSAVQEDIISGLNQAENQQTGTADVLCSADAVRLSEFLPDPEGDDANEWVELENFGPAEACLAGWSLDDAEGGSKPFMLAASHLIPPFGFLVIHKSESKLALNNDGDSVRLIRPDGSVAESVTYAAPPTGMSYSRTESGWAWSEPSLGAENVAAPAAEPAAAADGDADAETEVPEEITTADVGEIDADTLVSLSGIVTLPPGRVGKTIFFIQHDGTATKIRSYSKSPPALSFGDEVVVTGRIRFMSDKPYVSALSKGGVEKIGRANLTAARRVIADISADDEGAYISVTGVLAKKGLNWLKIGDDSDSGEIRINLPEPVASTAKAGDSVTATGTVKLKSGVPEIMILKMDDVTITPAVLPEEAVADAPASDTAVSGLQQNETGHKIPAWPFLVFGAAAAGAIAVWRLTRPLPLADLPEPPAA